MLSTCGVRCGLRPASRGGQRIDPGLRRERPGATPGPAGKDVASRVKSRGWVSAPGDLHPRGPTYRMRRRTSTACPAANPVCGPCACTTSKARMRWGSLRQPVKPLAPPSSTASSPCPFISPRYASDRSGPSRLPTPRSPQRQQETLTRTCFPGNRFRRFPLHHPQGDPGPLHPFVEAVTPCYTQVAEIPDPGRFLSESGNASHSLG